MDIEALFANSRTALLLCDGDRRIVDVNAAATALLRRPAERLVGHRPEELVTEPGRAAAARELASIPAGGSPGWLPFALETGDGTPFRAELTWRSEYLPGRHLVALRPAAVQHDLGDDEGVLTERESAILSRVAHGMTGPEIAEELFLSTATVERHVASALRRLGARNRAHGIAIAVRTGQLEPGAEAAGASPGSPGAAHQLVLEALDGPAALLDRDGRTVAENAAWRALDHIDPRHAIARAENYLEALDRAGDHSADAAEAALGIREVLEGHVVCFVLEYRVPLVGDERWFELRVSRYDGQAEALLVRHRDVTGQRHAELGASMLDEVDAAVIFMDLEGVVTGWRPSAERLFGVAPSRAVGRPAWDTTMERRERDIGRAIVDEAVREGRWAGEVRLVRDDGSSFHSDVRLRVVRDAAGDPVQLVAAVVDVTARVDALRRSLDAQEELRAVTSSMRDGCIVLDATGRICSANPAVTQHLGWPADELLGRNMHEVLRSPLPGGAPPRAVREGPGGPIHEDRFVTRDGHEVHVEYTAARFRSADNSERWAIVFRPLTLFGEPLEGLELGDADLA
jgi:PAS domain S-box-containing protein